jgi:hypothetical protein
MPSRIVIAVLGWLALTLPGVAQDDLPETAPDDQPPAPAEAGAGGTDAEDDADAGADDDAADGTVVDEFIFSEEIPADQQLVFPVDI